MKEYIPWIIVGLIGIAIMLSAHVIKLGELSKAIKTDITGKNVILSGFASSVLFHIVAIASGDKEAIVWAIVTIPQLGIYSLIINALIAAIFNTIVYETNKRRKLCPNEEDAPGRKTAR
ncbi:MAG: hypothetical protein GJV46_11535 [Geobacter sp.]|nr:hypothetical protein [Geobacter sp.]